MKEKLFFVIGKRCDDCVGREVAVAVEQFEKCA
jgi:hypothetical protein